jgi:hypothetical protein
MKMETEEYIYINPYLIFSDRVANWSAKKSRFDVLKETKSRHRRVMYILPTLNPRAEFK